MVLRSALLTIFSGILGAGLFCVAAIGTVVVAAVSGGSVDTTRYG